MLNVDDDFAQAAFTSPYEAQNRNLMPPSLEASISVEEPVLYAYLTVLTRMMRSLFFDSATATGCVCCSRERGPYHCQHRSHT